MANQLFAAILLVCAAAAPGAGEDTSFARARASAKIAGYSLGKVRRWLHGGVPLELQAGKEKCLILKEF
jgi:hypothetical protein